MTAQRKFDGDRIRDLRNQGLCIAEIARRVGCSQHSVRYHLEGYRRPGNGVEPPAPRKCMRCERTFRPTHRYNFMCSGCHVQIEALA